MPLILQEVVYVGTTPFNRSLFNPIQNFPKDSERGGIKPHGGLWTSPVNSVCPWKNIVLDCKSGNKVFTQVHLSIKPNAKIVVIDSYSDLLKQPFRNDMPDCIDWELLAKSYDAIWLTAEGMLDTILSRPHLCGWDCETVLFFNAKCLY